MQVSYQPSKAAISKLTNPEQKSATPQRQKHSSFSSVDSHLFQTLEDHLENCEYEDAKLAAQNNSFLMKYVNSRIISKDLHQLLTRTYYSDQVKHFEKHFEGQSKQELELFNAAKQLKQKTSLNSSLIECLSSILKDIGHGVHSDQIQQGLRRNSALSQKIFRPLKEIQRRIKLNRPKEQNQIEKELRQKYLECKVHQSKIASLQRQLELVNNNVLLKGNENAKIKHKIKLYKLQNIKLKTERSSKKDQNLMKVHQEYKKYIDSLHKVYNKEERSAYTADFIDSEPTDEGQQIDKLIAKLQQSISYHKSTFDQLLFNHQKEIDGIKSRYQEEIQQLSHMLQEKMKAKMQEQSQLYKLQYDNVQVILNERKEKIGQLENQNKELKQKVAQQIKIKKELQSKMSNQTKKLNESIASMQKKIKLKDQLLEAQRLNSKALSSRIQDKEMQVDQKERQKNFQITELASQLARSRASFQQLECRYSEQAQKRRNLSRQVQELNELCQRLENQGKQKQSIISTQKTQNRSNIQPIQQNQDQLLKIRQERQELLKNVSELTEQTERQIAEKESWFTKMEELTSKNSSLQKMLQFHKSKQKESEQKFNLADKKLKSLIADSQFKKIHSEEYVGHLFGNEILDSEPEYKLFLKNVLEDRYKSKIFRTNLLYKNDPLNKNNFHQHIDNKDNIFALVKLLNGNIIACFSQGKIFPKMIADKDGLLISVTNKEIFELAQTNKRAVFYDDFFFILGNSEFRVKSGQLKFFSNFAVSNGYYRARGQKVSVITGSNEREVALVNLEFYQIVFY